MWSNTVFCVCLVVISSQSKRKLWRKRRNKILKICANLDQISKHCRHRLFPFRKQAMPFLTVNDIIGNQAFQNERSHICFSLGLDKVETGYNLLMEQNPLTKCLIVHNYTGLLAVSFYFMV